jgi:hypothetical protein
MHHPPNIYFMTMKGEALPKQMIGFRPEKILYRSASSVRIVLECFKKPLQTNEGAAVRDREVD